MQKFGNKEPFSSPFRSIGSPNAVISVSIQNESINDESVNNRCDLVNIQPSYR
jgi:hypothetical protein